MNELIYKEESFKIVGCCFEVYNNLGKGLLENVYKDALEFELEKNNIPFEREKHFPIEYKGEILKHHYVADFIVYDKIILEIKCTKAIADEHMKQTLNYLGISKFKLGLIINFGEESVKYKRLVLN